MPPSVSATRSYTGDYETVFDAACWAALEAGMTVNHADRVSGVISLSAPASWSSWGENLGIRIGQASPGHIQVIARSTQFLGEPGDTQQLVARARNQVDEKVQIAVLASVATALARGGAASRWSSPIHRRIPDPDAAEDGPSAARTVKSSSALRNVDGHHHGGRSPGSTHPA